MDSKNEYYILYSPYSNKVQISSDYQETLKNWRQSSRISPVFPFSGDDKTINNIVNGTYYTLAFGFIDPNDFREYFQPQISSYYHFLTYGLMNNFIISESESFILEAQTWLKEKNTIYEMWKICNFEIKNKTVTEELDKEYNLNIDYTLFERNNKSLHPYLHEYIPLIKAVINKSHIFFPLILGELSNFHNTVEKVLLYDDNKFSLIMKMNFITTICASLSRFSSQLFSGVSTIAENPSYFWNHSLFGIGLPIIGIIRLKQYIELFSEQTQIVQRLELYNLIKNEKPCDDTLYNKDANFLKHQKVESKIHSAPKDFIKNIVCFSGRDGFKSSRATVSVPLISISACNSIAWSPMTLTHELCHQIAESALSWFYPPIELDDENADNNQENTKVFIEKFKDETRCDHLLDEIQIAFLKQLIQIHSIETKDISFSIKGFIVFLRDIKNSSHRLINEIITQLLDYKYFYDSNTTIYHRNIWVSWSMIPNINVNVEEYIFRTLCITMTKYIDDDDRYELAKRDLYEDLNALIKLYPHSNLLQETIRKMNDTSFWSSMKLRLAKHKSLILLLLSTLFSVDFAGKFGKDIAHRTGTGTKKYNFTYLDFTSTSISNPVDFLKTFSDEISYNSLRSYWVLYKLAFSKDNIYG